MTITCRLFINSSAEHLTQIYTGFGLLERAGLVNLELVKDNHVEIGIMSKPILKVIINGKIKVVYDTFDGDSLFKDELNWSDLYFKRSFNSLKINSEEQTSKIYPLGFNYSAYGPNDHYLRRISWQINKELTIPKFRDLAVQLVRNNYLLSRLFNTSNGRFVCNYKQFEQLPRFDLKPSVIFYTRLWDPDRNKQTFYERIQMNEFRVNIIKNLRNQFKDSFKGGLEATDFAIKNYPEYVIYDRKITRKNKYLNQLRQATVGIATKGLLGSNGWKLAEYISSAKAIVSEPLMYGVPGEFLPGKNYLEFTTPQGCIEAVQRLFDDSALRYSQMKNNYDYYNSFLKPDILIWNTLQSAILKGLD